MGYNKRVLQGLAHGYQVYEKLVERIKYINYRLLLILPLVSFLFLPFSWTVSIFTGLGVGALNFHLLSRNLGSTILSGPLVGDKYIIFRYYLRLTFTGIVLYLLIRSPWLNLLALFVGLALSLANILLTTLYSNRGLSLFTVRRY